MLRLLRKALIVHNDLELGHGLVLQSRGPVIRLERKIELTFIFRSVDEIKGLDTERYTRVRLHAAGPTTEYWYDSTSTAIPNDTTVLKPDTVQPTNPGRWLVVQYGDASSHDQLGGLQGGATGEYFHLTNAEHTAFTTHLTANDNPHSVTWSQLIDKPSTFPPASHTHHVFNGPGQAGLVPDPGTASGLVLSDSGAWVTAATGGGSSESGEIDGGFANSNYPIDELLDGGYASTTYYLLNIIEGGSANSTYLPLQFVDGGFA